MAQATVTLNRGLDIQAEESCCCPFRQYMPSKPAKYGIKSWVVCNVKSSYAWKMQIYTGKPAAGQLTASSSSSSAATAVGGRGPHNVTCDTSYELRRQLLRRNFTMVGTVRKNKPKLPPALLAVKGRVVHSSLFAFTGTTRRCT